MELALDYQTNEESESHEKIEQMHMLSMSEEELNKGIQGLSNDISTMSATLRKMKAIHKEISEEAGKEEVRTYSQYNNQFAYCLYKCLRILHLSYVHHTGLNRVHTVIC